MGWLLPIEWMMNACGLISAKTSDVPLLTLPWSRGRTVNLQTILWGTKLSTNTLLNLSICYKRWDGTAPPEGRSSSSRKGWIERST